MSIKHAQLPRTSPFALNPSRRLACSPPYGCCPPSPTRQRCTSADGCSLLPRSLLDIAVAPTWWMKSRRRRATYARSLMKSRQSSSPLSPNTRTTSVTVLLQPVAHDGSTRQWRAVEVRQTSRNDRSSSDLMRRWWIDPARRQPTTTGPSDGDWGNRFRRGDPSVTSR